MTAIGWRAAAAGLTISPVRGSGTSDGLGTGVGVGDGVGATLGATDGATDGLVTGGLLAWPDDGLVARLATRPRAVEALGPGEDGEQAASRTATAAASPTRRTRRSRLVTSGRISEAPILRLPPPAAAR